MKGNSSWCPTTESVPSSYAADLVETSDTVEVAETAETVEVADTVETVEVVETVESTESDETRGACCRNLREDLLLVGVVPFWLLLAAWLCFSRFLLSRI